MNPVFSYNLPAYFGVASEAIVIDVGVPLPGAEFVAAFFDPNGVMLAAPTVTITDPVNGVISILLPVVALGSLSGEYRFTCNWSNNNNLLVGYGVVLYTDPVGQTD